MEAARKAASIQHRGHAILGMGWFQFFFMLLALAILIGSWLQKKRYAQRLLAEFENPDPQIRGRVIREIQSFLERATTDDIIRLLIRALTDQEPSIRMKAASIFKEKIDSYISRGKNRTPVISAAVRPAVIYALCNALEDDETIVRRYAASALTKTDTSLVINPFIKALRDPDQQVRRLAAQALKKSNDIRAVPPLLALLESEDRLHAAAALDKLCRLVQTLVYGGKDHEEFDRAHTLYNPNLFYLTVPMPKLRQIVMYANTCNIRHIEALARYISGRIEEHQLRKRIRLMIYGGVIDFPAEFSQAFSQCEHVDIDIETVVFGNKIPIEVSARTTWQNPDSTNFMLPLKHLQQIAVYPATYDFHLLERFLTYAVNYIGQKQLKKQVTVHIHGDPDALDQNLRNNFEHLCKEVVVH